MTTGTFRAVCFVDALSKDRRRYSYWEDVARELGTVAYQEVSIPDLAAHWDRGGMGDLPPLAGADVVILNNDVANGGYEYGSDRTVHYFLYRGRGDLERAIRTGKRIVIEMQTASGRPLQSVYDTLLGSGEVTVSPLGEDRPDTTCWTPTVFFLNEKRRKHPIFANVPNLRINPNYISRGESPFPSFSNPNTVGAQRPGYAYWGYFSHWKGGWIPLLFASTGGAEIDKKAPIMLARSAHTPEGYLGEEIVTTMRFGQLDCHQFHQNLLCYKSGSTLLENFYRSAYRRHWWKKRLAQMGLWIVFIAVVATVAKLKIVAGHWPDNLRTAFEAIVAGAVPGGLAIIFYDRLHKRIGSWRMK